MYPFRSVLKKSPKKYRVTDIPNAVHFLNLLDLKTRTKQKFPFRLMCMLNLLTRIETCKLHVFAQGLSCLGEMRNISRKMN